MDMRSSRSDSAAAMHPDPVRAMISELKSTSADPGEILVSKLKERAYFAYNTAKIVESDAKPFCGVACPRVCGAGSEAALSESLSELDAMKVETFDPHVVEELLGVVKSEPIFVRNDDKKQLLSQLLAPNLGMAVTFSVIPIVGASGIGKTTLARVVYEDKMVQEHFELKVWVRVDGQRVQALDDVARIILKSATGMTIPLNSQVKLDEMVRDALLSQRSLIVLDEVESIDSESWMRMKQSWFRFVGMGSKVIITTRTDEVATTVARGSPIRLGTLSNDDGLSLFSAMAFPHSERTDDAGGLISVAQRLAARCNGSPLSLKLLGSLMRFERTLLEDLSSADSTFALDITCILSLSVLALPGTLFNCFAYCGIFSCGYGLEREKLIRMWIADGVIKPSMRMKTMEETGEAYFRQLLCRSFFTDVTYNEYGDIVQARMPSVVHEFARRMAADVYMEKLSQVVSNSSKSDTQLNYLKLKRLRSLNLSGLKLHDLPEVICRLRKLRYLNLSHNLLTRLPESFPKLAQMQTLDLSRCYFLEALPEKMSNLLQLKHLDLSRCNSLQYMPSGMGCLNSLMTMPLYVLGEKHIKRAGLEQLHNLKDLRGVLHIRNLENVTEISDAQAADLCHKNFHHLGLSWSHKVDVSSKVLEYLEPNAELKVFDLTGYAGHGFPSWMSNLHNLVKLSINDCECTEVPTLGELPFLKELQIKGMIKISSIGQEFYGYGGAHYFPSLEKLKLHEMPNLTTWSDAFIEQGSDHSPPRVFPRLKKLTIQGCLCLESLPSLPYVTELVVWRSCKKIILPLLTTMKSLSSVVINNMDVRESFESLGSLSLGVKNLIVIHSMDLDSLACSHIGKFPALEHLRILHCRNLKKVELSSLGSLKKLSIVDCQILEKFKLLTENSILTELVIEDCPRLKSIGNVASLASSIRKLIVRNCPNLSFCLAEIKKLQGLEFLFISTVQQT